MNNQIDNCRFYYNKTGNDYYCASCNANSAGVINDGTGNIDYKGLK